MTGPEGNSKFCFPRISMFSETKSTETLRFQGPVIKWFVLLLVFSVTPFKIDQNRKSKPFNRLIPESGK